MRLSSTITQLPPEEKLERLRLYTELREQHTTSAGISAYAASRRIRLNRRYFYNDLPPSGTRLLTETRSSVPRRRASTALQSYNVTAAPQLVVAEYAAFPNRHQQAFISRRVYAARKEQKQRRYVDTRGQLSTHQAAPINSAYNKPFAQTDRSVLQYRAAKQRMIRRVYQPGRVVKYAGLYADSQLVRTARAAKRANELLQRAHASAAKLSGLLAASTSSRAEHYQLLLQRAQDAISQLNARVERLARVATPSAGLFSTQGFRRAATARLFTRACLRLQRKSKRTVFDTFRSKL